ncbi:hypothetical protein BKM17_10210 [Pseudomonas syringae group genomosp. 3]|nr:hypothetical protein BKM17_10210 [Pseudomonas syringae group genomosp. 3]
MEPALSQLTLFQGRTQLHCHLLTRRRELPYLVSIQLLRHSIRFGKRFVSFPVPTIKAFLIPLLPDIIERIKDSFAQLSTQWACFGQFGAFKQLINLFQSFFNGFAMKFYSIITNILGHL